MTHAPHTPAPRLARRFAVIAGGALALSFAANAFAQSKLETAVFAGGCFWTMEHGLETIPGVVKAPPMSRW